LRKREGGVARTAEVRHQKRRRYESSKIWFWKPRWPFWPRWLGGGRFARRDMSQRSVARGVHPGHVASLSLLCCRSRSHSRLGNPYGVHVLSSCVRRSGTATRSVRCVWTRPLSPPCCSLLQTCQGTRTFKRSRLLIGSPRVVDNKGNSSTVTRAI